MSLIKPVSHCPNCNYSLKWYDLIPVFSYIFLKGKCRNCKNHISARYPFVELLNCVLWILCLIKFTDVIISTNVNEYVMFVSSCIFCSSLICVFFCDYDNMEIPDTFQIITLLCGLVMMICTPVVTPQSRALGFVVGGGFFLLISLLFYLVKRVQGLGFGDVKLMAVTGFVLGLENTILTIVLSAVFGAIVLLIINFAKKGGKNKEYPFAVFIVPCAILALFVGEYIVNWYMSLFAL